MLNPVQMQDRILNLASNDTRIRAVLLNGSRANSKVKPDAYQDFDCVFIVEEFDSFLNDRSWFNTLGTPILQQLPDEMELGSDPNIPSVSFGFLTYFEGGDRLDLTLFPKEKLTTHFSWDSLTVVWLDKDALFPEAPASSDRDYHTKRPTQRQFNEVSNEFWWCAVNVAKGLKRGEITYAKDMLETTVRPMLMDLLAWNIGSAHEFQVSIGKSGKFIQQYLIESDYKQLMATYSDGDIANNWTALFALLDLFQRQQKEVAQALNFTWNEEEIQASYQIITDINTRL